MEKLVKKLKIETTLELITGLHIGGSSESVEIGGIDNPIIKIATYNNQPYIPGSSLKGKVRCLLEQIEGASEIGGGTKQDGKVLKFENKPEGIKKIINLFGFANDNKPSKIIFRDAYLMNNRIVNDENNWAEKLENSDFLDMPYTESKWENVIHRVEGTADHRQMERVPAGVKFDVEIIINIWGNDDEKEVLNILKKGLKALELDYLGGSGSRGYGKVKFNWDMIENHDPIELSNL